MTKKRIEAEPVSQVVPEVYVSGTPDEMAPFPHTAAALDRTLQEAERRAVETPPVENLTVDEAASLTANARKGEYQTSPLVPGVRRLRDALRVSTSIDLTAPDAWKRVYRSLISEDIKGRTVMHERLQVRDWLVHDIDLPDPQTGELKPCLRSVLILEDGARVSFVSDGIARSLTAIHLLRGPAPWTPATVCIPKSGAARIGEFKYLDVD